VSRGRPARPWAIAGLLLLAGSSLAASPLPVEEVAQDVFVHRGVNEDFSPGNRGGIANLAFVVGQDAVAVIDSGGSLAEGQDLLLAIRSRTALPVRFVVDTHGHPDHVLGNAAFAGPDTQVVGHARLAAAMAARGPSYLASMGRLLGPAAEGATLVPPKTTVPVGEELALDLGGRKLVLHAWPTAHTDSDLTAFDTMTRTLFAGDLVFMERLPVVDGSLLGWLALMPELARLPAQRVVPGHGPVSAAWPAALEPERTYLEGLRDQVRAALKRGLTLSQAVDAIPLPGAAWQLREDNHPRNVTAAYTELEWE
jgi:quinoprotein relay system zinc metallohydrolase 2